jgi:hypothetical protein
MDSIKDNPNIIFIGGSGRSGTNITKDLFSLHPQVFTLPFEYRFIIDPGGIIDFYNSFSSAWSPYYADKKIKELEDFLLKLAKRKFIRYTLGNLLSKINKRNKLITPAEYYGWELRQWFTDYERIVNDFIDELRVFSYRGMWPGARSYRFRYEIDYMPYLDKRSLAGIIGRFLQDLYRSMLKRQNKQCFVEDNTWNILFAEQLFELVPGAKLVHVVRDPRDVVNSLRKQRWAPGDLNRAVSFYLDIMTRWSDVKQCISKEDYIEIKLEDLVLDKANTIRRLLDFCGLAFDEGIMQIDLKESFLGIWRKELSEKETEFLNEKLGSIMNRYNYPE